MGCLSACFIVIFLNLLKLKSLAKNYNSKATIYRQLNPLGTGHAIMCAEKPLSGKALVIYPDTLIKTNETLQFIRRDYIGRVNNGRC